MMESLYGFLIALAASLLLHIGLRKPALSLGLVDVPQGRKAHRGAVPLIGGLAMFCAYVFSVALIGADSHVLAWIAGAALLVVCGLIDDLFFVTPACKLTVQTVAAALVVLCTGDVLRQIGWFGTLEGQQGALVGVALTILFLVGMSNAFNMMDGADGLGGGLALIAAAWLALAAALAGRAAEAGPLTLLAGVLVGFLAFNARLAGRRREAVVFMGDAGSLMLGFLLAVFATRLCQAQSAGIPFVALLWVFALPLVDAASVIVRRAAAGGTPFRADCRHLHQLCRRAGWSVERTVNTLLAASALLGAVGVCGWQAGVSDGVMLMALAVPVLLHSALVRHCSAVVSRSAPARADFGVPTAIGTSQV